MYSINQLEDFLGTIESFYKADEGKEKEGIGHEIEHINGVILRAMEYAELVNSDLAAYKQKEPVDMGIVATCAALHDIGNVIERDAHGQYAYGIVMGRLSLNDFFKVPYKNSVTGSFFNNDDLERFKKAVKINGYSFSAMDTEFYHAALSFLTAQVFFDLSYNERNISSEIELRHYLKQYEHLSSDLEDAIVKNLFDKDGEILATYKKELKNMTFQLQQIFGESSKEIEIIANAVQDHNVDYKNELERYRARSIYGMIVSDADKDTVPEVFAIRTIAYAANKLGVQKHKEYCLEKNPTEEQIEKWGEYVPDLIKCATHVMHQSWERFKTASITSFWKEIAEYKEDLKGVKGIGDVKSIDKPKNNEAIARASEGKSHVIDSRGKMHTFIIIPKEGDDVKSQLDDFSNTTKVRDSRKSFIETVRFWSDPQNTEESMKKLVELAQEWDAAISNEEIIGKYEAAARPEMFKTSDEYSFKNIIEKVLSKGCIKGYRDNGSLDSMLSTATAESTQEKKEIKSKEQKTSKDVKDKNTKNNDDPNLQ